MRNVVLLSALLLASLMLPRFPATPVAHAATPPAPPRWAAQRVLELNRAGSGRVVVALGDPSRARHVAIVVPGVGNNLATFDDPAHPERRPYGMALALRSAAPNTSVIAWLGYQTPPGLDVEAVTGDEAEQGARLLRQFVDNIRAHAEPGTMISLVCHSYGSVVCGLAAPDLPVDNMVFLGSPGVRATSVAGLHTHAAVYAATARTDWIRWVPHIEIGDYGHGPDPTEPAFGARPLPTTGVSGHDGYFAPGSPTLRAISTLVSQDRRG
jgi:alpha/beta hydrolase family protein